MPIRNPFSKRSDLTSGTNIPRNEDSNRFEKVDTVGSRSSSSAMSTSQKIEPAEYKMMVNDNGVFVPPSPPEKKNFWPKRPNLTSTASSTSRSSFAEDEPFSISRESFDSYRRSFDISARSPVIQQELNPRGRLSLDAIPRLPRSAVGDRRFEREPPTAEEGFEEVGLNDENKQPAQAAKKKGFFSKFGDAEHTPPQSPNTSTSRFHLSGHHLPGRKRAQSGQGAELGEISRPGTAKQVIPEIKEN